VSDSPPVDAEATTTPKRRRRRSDDDAEATTTTGDLKTALTGVAFVLFGVQVTLVELFVDANSLFVAAGIAVSFGGLFRALTA